MYEDARDPVCSLILFKLGSKFLLEVLQLIQGDPREVIKSKRLLHPEEIHFIEASWMQNFTDI